MKLIKQKLLFVIFNFNTLESESLVKRNDFKKLNEQILPRNEN